MKSNTRHTWPQSGYETDPPGGTMHCPICDSSVPHEHSGLEVRRHRERYTDKGRDIGRQCAKCLGTGISGFGRCHHCEEGICCRICCAHQLEDKRSTTGNA